MLFNLLGFTLLWQLPYWNFLHESPLEFLVKLLKETVYLVFLYIRAGQRTGQDVHVSGFQNKEFNSRVFLKKIATQSFHG